MCACREYGFPTECYRKTGILSASAEPSAPVERDELADFEAYMDEIVRINHVNGTDYQITRRCDFSSDQIAMMRDGWVARAALERKP